MSKVPAKQKPDQARKSPKSLKKAKEIDLWDLDADESGIESAGAQMEKAEAGSDPKKPAESGIDTADVPQAGEKPSTETEETAAGSQATATGARASFASITRTEKIAVTALFAALALAASIFLVHFSKHVPTRSSLGEEIDFPVSGKLIEITSANTYWRKPATSGENRDVARPGTAFIPVLEISLKAKPCAIRVFFRNDEGVLVGDGISRNVSGEMELRIPATAGFDDPGMHSAYRTGEKEPWIVQVFEGANQVADHEDLRKVLETQISTDIR